MIQPGWTPLQMMMDPDEGRFLVKHTPLAGSRRALLDYATFLEGRDDARAELLRLEHALSASVLPQGHDSLQRRRLALQAQLAPFEAWFQLISPTDRLLNCGLATSAPPVPRFTFECPMQWEALSQGPSPNTRHCDQCHQTVHLCPSVDAVETHAKAGHCIAVPVQVTTSVHKSLTRHMVGRPNVRELWGEDIFRDHTQTIASPPAPPPEIMNDPTLKTLALWRHREVVEDERERIADPPEDLDRDTVSFWPAISSALGLLLGLALFFLLMGLAWGVFAGNIESGLIGGAGLGTMLCFGLLLFLGDETHGAARTRALWRLVQHLKHPFGLASTRRERVIKTRDVEIPVELTLTASTPPRLRWRFCLDQQIVLGEHQVLVSDDARVPAFGRPQPEGEVVLKERQVTFNLNRDPSHDDQVHLEVRSLREDAASLTFTWPVADDASTQLARLPALEARGVTLDEAALDTWRASLGEIAEALGSPLPRELCAQRVEAPAVATAPHSV